MDMKEIRRKLGEKIIGETLPDTAKIKTGFTLVSLTNLDLPGNLVRAKHEVDKFWKRDGKNVQKIWLEQFIAELEGDPLRYSHIYALSANHNKLVNDGTRMLSRWFLDIATNSAAGASITTRVSRLQLGTSSAAHAANQTGCVSPITTPSSMAEAAATVSQVTTDTSYTYDTVQLQKTDFLNNSGGGTVVTVNEIAIRNNDTVKIAFCRTTTNSTAVADTGTLNATYKLQIVAA